MNEHISAYFVYSGCIDNFDFCIYNIIKLTCSDKYVYLFSDISIHLPRDHIHILQICFLRAEVRRNSDARIIRTSHFGIFPQWELSFRGSGKIKQPKAAKRPEGGESMNPEGS